MNDALSAIHSVLRLVKAMSLFLFLITYIKYHPCTALERRKGNMRNSISKSTRFLCGESTAETLS